MDPNGIKTPPHATSIVRSSPHLDVIPHTVVSEEKYFEEKYSMLQKLGEGSFGVVYEAIHRDSGEHCACKIVHKEKVGFHFDFRILIIFSFIYSIQLVCVCVCVCVCACLCNFLHVCGVITFLFLILYLCGQCVW